jgi:hypothetical protein
MVFNHQVVRLIMELCALLNLILKFVDGDSLGICSSDHNSLDRSTLIHAPTTLCDWATVTDFQEAPSRRRLVSCFYILMFPREGLLPAHYLVGKWDPKLQNNGMMQYNYLFIVRFSTQEHKFTTLYPVLLPSDRFLSTILSSPGSVLQALTTATLF